MMVTAERRNRVYRVNEGFVRRPGACWTALAGLFEASRLSLGEVRPPVLLLVTLLLGSVASGQDAKTANPSDWEGRTIERIDFEPTDQPLPRDEMDKLLSLHPGAALKIEDVRESIRRMYATGEFTDIVVDGEPVGTAVVLRISTERAYFVQGVTADGTDDPPNRNQLIAASKLELGQPFQERDMEQALANLRERLRANGLYQAKVEPTITREASTGGVEIHFAVDPGDRAHFAGAEVRGKFSQPAESVVKTTGWHRGLGFIPFPGWREATESRVQSGVEKVRQMFVKDNRLQARVILDDLNYEEKTNTVTPTIAVDPGPVIEVLTSGVKISKGRLRRLIPVYEERTVDRGLLIEGNRNLIDYFQAKGYFDVESDFVEAPETKGVQVIEYNITRNARHKLVKIEIAGNKFFDDATLRERLTIREAAALRSRYGRYSQKLRDQDRDGIRDLYRANGFRDVMVTATTVDDYQGREDELAVRFEIQEGEPWSVENLTIDGADQADNDYLRGIVQSLDGQAFSEANVAADRDAILAYYLNNGYPDVVFDWSQTPGAAERRVHLRYVIRPGARQYVRNVLVRGLDSTRPSLVNNRISVRPGDPVSQSQIAESQQKLYDLGIFSKVQTALQNPDGAGDHKYALFHIDEAARYSFTAALGAELARIGGGVTTFDSPAGKTAFSPRISMGISRLNVLGLAHTVSLQGLLSTLEKRVLASYAIPQFNGNENLALTTSALFDTSRDVRTFKAQRWEGSVQLAQRLSRANSLQYRYSFRLSQIDESTLKISSGLIPLLSQPVRVGMVALTFIQDRRDSPTDSHRGMYNTVDAGISLSQFGSETEFTRLLFRNSTYHSFGREFVIARTLQFGYVQRLGGLPEIPLAERYYAGGSSSQRAFPDNQAGPRDTITGFPLGGSALLFHQTEFRFPLFGENIGGVLFHDMGNVYTNIREVSFRFHQRDFQDFDYLVHGFGFGIRYRTPVGPVRLDLSYSPNSPHFAGFQGTRDELLLCTPATPCPTVPQRINQFQFHFSLGQTF